jgi:acetoin utilization protein AcuC
VQLRIGAALARYGFGDDHPFGPDRSDAFWRAALSTALQQRVHAAPPVMADEAALRRFHTAAYIRRVQRQSETGDGFLDAGDTPTFKGVFEAAATVAGSVLAALADIMQGAVRRAFIPIAGLHHARRDIAAGFCVFNDAGILIETLRSCYGINRIAYIDIDAQRRRRVLRVRI